MKKSKEGFMKTLKFKRIFTALLAVMLIVSMAVAATACGKKSSSTDTNASTTAAAEDGNERCRSFFN